MVTTVRRCTSCFCALGTLPFENSTLVFRKLCRACAHLVPSTCWEHILKGEGVHDQPESFVVERGLGTRTSGTPPRKLLFLRQRFRYPPLPTLSGIPEECFMQPLCVFSVLYLRSNSWSLAFATGCARRRSPPDRRRLFRSAAQHGMEACAALMVMMFLQKHARKHPSEVPVLAVPLLVRWTLHSVFRFTHETGSIASNVIHQLLTVSLFDPRRCGGRNVTRDVCLRGAVCASLREPLARPLPPEPPRILAGVKDRESAAFGRMVDFLKSSRQYP